MLVSLTSQLTMEERQSGNVEEIMMKKYIENLPKFKSVFKIQDDITHAQFYYDTW